METIDLTIRIPKPTRKWLQYRLRTLLILMVLVGIVAAFWAGPRFLGWSSVQSAVLLSRSKHNDYDKATFSFEHGIRDDPSQEVTRNDWDIEFGNGGDLFGVTMVTDDCSRILDLGKLTWREIRLANLPHLPAHPSPTREPQVPAIPGHMYMVHTKDRETDSYALFRVDSLTAGDRCRISWRVINEE